jgi:hypothetical protein
MVQGRVIYETMEGFWRAARDDASLPDYLREYGDIWTTVPKILVSRSRTTADHNTRIIGGEDTIEQLAAVQARADGDIGVGGARPSLGRFRVRQRGEPLTAYGEISMSAVKVLADVDDNERGHRAEGHVDDPGAAKQQSPPSEDHVRPPRCDADQARDYQWPDRPPGEQAPRRT